MRDDFCVFILTHGRPDKVLTYRTLRRAGYTGKIFIVVDDEDKTRHQYMAEFGEQVLVFSKADIASRFDEADNFCDRRSIFYARNACFDQAKLVGCKYFIQLDDDYHEFQFRVDRNYDQAYFPIRKLDAILSEMLAYYESIPALSIAMSQGGDFLGDNGGHASWVKRKAMNSFICSVDRPFSFMGRINEDVNTYTNLGRCGELFMTIGAVQLGQKQTQKNSGGMTELYLDSGTYVSHATDAAGSARAASTSAGQAASSAQSASSSAGTASTKATEASKSAAAAESSKSAAATSASAAKTSETNAAASQQSAATSASTATTKASEAATSARDASASKEAAKSSETNASSSASSAASSATAAGNSAKAAKTSETNARSSETAAGQSASAAAGSKTAAASSASAASTSAGQASASATAAGKSAESAASSASTATTKAGEATEQASAAARSASAAKTSETNAKASETSAESSKTAAASSASSAASSASSASASKDEATRQASAAKSSATTASTKATEAAGSATAAAQSKSTAESAATRAETAAKRAEDIASAVALEDASTTKKGIVQLSSATNSTSETLAATPKAVKSAYDNAEKRLQKDQNGADIPDKGCFLNNINAVSKTDFADKRGMRYVRVNAPAGATSGKYYPVVVMRSAGSVSELASRVIITTATRTAGDPMNNCEFNGFVMPGGWTDRGRYAYGMFWQYQNNERAIHSIMMSNKGDDLRSVFYVDGAAFPVFAFIEDGLSISAPGADLVVNDTTYKFGATNPATECIAADVILDFKSGRGFYESHSLIVNDNLSCKKLFATDEIVARGGNQIRMNRWGVWCIMA